MTQRRAVFDKALVTRQRIGDIEPSNALQVEGMAGRHQQVRLVEGAEVNLDDIPQFLVSAVTFPGQRRAFPG
jgi:hypothetical protein